MSLIGRIKKKGDTLNIPGRGLVLWKQIPKLIRALGLDRDIKLMVDGADSVDEIEDGLKVKISPGTAAADLPFLVTSAPDGSGNAVVTVTAGTFHGIVPTLGGTSLDAATPPTATVSATGTVRFYLTVNATLTADNNYVHAYSFSTVTVNNAGSVPADTTTSPAVYHIPIATIVDGSVTAQFLTSSLDGFVEDDGTAASKGILSWFQS